MRRLLAVLTIAACGTLAFAGTASADAQHANPPASLRCPDGFQLTPLSFFLNEFGVDLSYLDFNGNGQLCNKFAPAQAQGNIIGVAIDDVAFAAKP